jgi:CO/xanthine dehydrogenase FAD-binding subunit
MKPVAFKYHRAVSVDDALQSLQNNPDSKIIAGGQSLIPVMNFRLSRPSVLVDINDVKALSFVKQTENGLRIGALIRHQELFENPLVNAHLPALAEAAGQVGHWAIRNRGTLGGSLTHADPASELPAAMVAFHATIEIASVSGKRAVPAEEFFLGFMTTDIKPNEMLVAVEIPTPTNVSWGFAEFARRPGDFALAGAFVELRDDGNGAVTWFGVSGGPERRKLAFPASDTDRQTALAELAEELEPLDQAAYRRHLAVLAAEQAYQQATGRRM